MSDAKKAEKNPLPRRFQDVLDRRKELTVFLEATSRLVPEVLDSLYKDVLPSIVEATLTISELAKSQNGTKFWTNIWDWANKHHLTGGMNIEYLKSTRGMELVDWVMLRSYISATPLPEHLAIPLNDLLAPEITFGTQLAMTVIRTLYEWKKTDHDATNLRWSPVPAPTLIGQGTDPCFLNIGPCDIRNILNDPEIAQAAAAQLGEEPYFYNFEVCAWNVRGESRTQAKSRILGQIEKLLDTYLDNRATAAVLQPTLEHRQKKNGDAHFEFLVQYQIQGLTFKEITDRDHDPEVENSSSCQVRITAGIKTAAEALIGPRYKEWLRQSKPGRPPKKRL